MLTWDFCFVLVCMFLPSVWIVCLRLLLFWYFFDCRRLVVGCLVLCLLIVLVAYFVC